MVGCGQTSARWLPSTTPSPPSTRPSGSGGRRSSAFVRERYGPIDAHYENASQLAEAAGVSVMSAFGLARQLSEEGFLEERSGLRLVRIEDAGTMVERVSIVLKRLRPGGY